VRENEERERVEGRAAKRLHDDQREPKRRQESNPRDAWDSPPPERSSVRASSRERRATSREHEETPAEKARKDAAVEAARLRDEEAASKAKRDVDLREARSQISKIVNDPKAFDSNPTVRWSKCYDFLAWFHAMAQAIVHMKQEKNLSDQRCDEVLQELCLFEPYTGQLVLHNEGMPNMSSWHVTRRPSEEMINLWRTTCQAGKEELNVEADMFTSKLIPYAGPISMCIFAAVDGEERMWGMVPDSKRWALLQYGYYVREWFSRTIRIANRLGLDWNREAREDVPLLVNVVREVWFPLAKDPTTLLQAWTSEYCGANLFDQKIGSRNKGDMTWLKVDVNDLVAGQEPGQGMMNVPRDLPEQLKSQLQDTEDFFKNINAGLDRRASVQVGPIFMSACWHAMTDAGSGSRGMPAANVEHHIGIFFGGMTSRSADGAANPMALFAMGHKSDESLFASGSNVIGAAKLLGVSNGCSAPGISSYGTQGAGRDLPSWSLCMIGCMFPYIATWRNPKAIYGQNSLALNEGPCPTWDKFRAHHDGAMLFWSSKADTPVRCDGQIQQFDSANWFGPHMRGGKPNFVTAAGALFGIDQRGTVLRDSRAYVLPPNNCNLVGMLLDGRQARYFSACADATRVDRAESINKLRAWMTDLKMALPTLREMGSGSDGIFQESVSPKGWEAGQLSWTEL